MATRTYCDHCGNTVREPTVLSFGNIQETLERNEKRHLQMLQSLQGGGFVLAGPSNNGGGGGGMGASAIGVQSKLDIEVGITHVDLCDTCVPIWIERVKKLCKASDPQE